MKAEFIELSAAGMERALDMMRGLYSEAGALHDRERARRAVAGLMANPGLGGVWLIKASKETVGYLCLTLCYSLEFDGRFALLDEIYLEKPWRSKGIGAQAIAFAAEWGRAHGIAAIRLEVAHTNGRAFKLYQLHGFKTDDRHLMTKWL